VEWGNLLHRERGDFIDDVNSILSAMNIPMRAE
jgi:hypothetical protein